MGTAQKDQAWQIIDADFGFGPVKIHFKPWNIQERRDILAARETSVTDFAVLSLVLRSRDETGARLWPNDADRQLIEREYDPDELDRVIGVMYAVSDTAGN